LLEQELFQFFVVLVWLVVSFYFPKLVAIVRSKLAAVAA